MADKIPVRVSATSLSELSSKTSSGSIGEIQFRHLLDGVGLSHGCAILLLRTFQLPLFACLGFLGLLFSILLPCRSDKFLTVASSSFSRLSFLCFFFFSSTNFVPQLCITTLAKLPSIIASGRGEDIFVCFRKALSSLMYFVNVYGGNFPHHLFLPWHHPGGLISYLYRHGYPVVYICPSDSLSFPSNVSKGRHQLLFVGNSTVDSRIDLLVGSRYGRVECPQFPLPGRTTWPRS